MNKEYQFRPTSISQVAAIYAYYKSLGWRFGGEDIFEDKSGLITEYFRTGVVFFNIANKYISYHRLEMDYRQTITFDNVFDLIPMYSPVTIPLNDKYTATVIANGKVFVGCQEFAGQVILNLAEAVQKSLDFGK